MQPKNAMRKHGCLICIIQYCLCFILSYPEATASDDRDDNITKIRDVLNWTDVLVLGSPNYHGSISGVLKNFLDYYFNEFVGKSFGYLCTSL
jgi:NAD(P)H-dependent FMN reductase